MTETLTRLRDMGWSIAIHNDYKLNGLPYTLWLFTHPSGHWVKGEGATDEELSARADEVKGLKDHLSQRTRDLAAITGRLERYLEH